MASSPPSPISPAPPHGRSERRTTGARRSATRPAASWASWPQSRIHSTISTCAAYCHSATRVSPRDPRPDLTRRGLLIFSPTVARGGAEDYILVVADAAHQAGWDVAVSIESRTATASLVRELESRPHVSYVDAAVGDDGTGARLAFVRQAWAASGV